MRKVTAATHTAAYTAEAGAASAGVTCLTDVIVYPPSLILVFHPHSDCFSETQMGFVFSVCVAGSLLHLIRPGAAAVRPLAPDCRPDQASDSPRPPPPMQRPGATACHEYTLATLELCSCPWKNNVLQLLSCSEVSGRVQTFSSLFFLGAAAMTFECFNKRL